MTAYVEAEWCYGPPTTVAYVSAVHTVRKPTTGCGTNRCSGIAAPAANLRELSRSLVLRPPPMNEWAPVAEFDLQRRLLRVLRAPWNYRRGQRYLRPRRWTPSPSQHLPRCFVRNATRNQGPSPGSVFEPLLLPHYRRSQCCSHRRAAAAAPPAVFDWPPPTAEWSPLPTLDAPPDMTADPPPAVLLVPPPTLPATQHAVAEPPATAAFAAAWLFCPPATEAAAALATLVATTSHCVACVDSPPTVAPWRRRCCYCRLPQ